MLDVRAAAPIAASDSGGFGGEARLYRTLKIIHWLSLEVHRRSVRKEKAVHYPSDEELMNSISDHVPSRQDLELWQRQRQAPAWVRDYQRRRRELYACGQYWLGVRDAAS